MTTTVAMHERSLSHIRDRLNALSLDINVITFDDEGAFTVNGAPVAAQDVVADYMWLSIQISDQKAREQAFATALSCQSINVLQTFNAGLDNPFYKKISDQGTRICNSSAQAVAISEYVMAQALSVIHPVDLQRTQQSQKMWQHTPFRELSRMNWLIVGFGPIGQAIAQRVKAFGASTCVIRRSKKRSAHTDTVGTLADLDTLAPSADVIVLACPLNNDTAGLANGDFFEHVKPGALLINIARGGLIDDAAMIAALDTGRLNTAVLDVFHTEPLPADNPLWSHPQVRLTPHTSFNGDGVHDRWDALFLDNITCFVNGEPLNQEVNPSDIV